MNLTAEELVRSALAIADRYCSKQGYDHDRGLLVSEIVKEFHSKVTTLQSHYPPATTDNPMFPYDGWENTGHGHVWPRPDGVKARCGGPGMCSACNNDEKWYLAYKGVR